MPYDQDSGVELFAFDWVPSIARGYVRDLRARWAMEEAGIPYRPNLISVADKPEDYASHQPFLQVPALVDGDICVFESGAILLHLGRKSETLMPRDPAGIAATESWLFAALNSIEQYSLELFFIHVVFADQEWARLRQPSCHDFLKRRLTLLSDGLAGRDYFAGPFTVADIVMATVLRDIDRHLPLADFPKLGAYLERCLARPAFKRALNAQMADFTGKQPEGFPA